MAARDRLLQRCLPLLRQWARGRLPRFAREMVDTDDLVQATLLRTLDRMQAFEPRRDGAFLAYLRKAVVNQVRDEIRRANRRPARQGLSEEMPTVGPSPLEEAIGKEGLARYEAALAALSPPQQEAVILRIEMGCSFEEIATATGAASAAAARMTVSRALVRIAESFDGR